MAADTCATPQPAAAATSAANSDFVRDPSANAAIHNATPIGTRDTTAGSKTNCSALAIDTMNHPGKPGVVH